MSFYDGVKWVGDIFYSPVRGASYIFTSLSSCPAYAIGASDGERCFFNYRFVSQIIDTNIDLLRSHSSNNPIYIITENVLHEAKQKNNANYVAELAKFYVKYKIKQHTVGLVYKEISKALVDYVMRTYFAGKVAKGFISGGVSMGIGTVLTGTSVMSEAHSAAMRLKAKNIVVYNKLSSRNVECFWFLVEGELKGFVY